MLIQKEHALVEILLNDALAKARNAGRITGVHVMAGEISEIRRDILQSAWLEVSRNTPAEGSQIHYKVIRAEVQCMACFQKYHPEGGGIHCPHCGSFGAKILSGEEFYVDSIEMENE